MVTTVHLMRHGEVHNPEGVLYGRLPGYRLSEQGQLMAQRVADFLAGQWDDPKTDEPATRRDIVTVIASPLQRAQETATPIAAAFDLPIVTDERLIEAGNHFEGMTFGVGDGSLRHPQHWPYLWNPFKPSWGEPYTEQIARMTAAVDAARESATGHEAVLVSHQLPVWITRSHYENRRLIHDPRKRQCSVASLTSLVFDGDKLLRVEYREPALDLLGGKRALPGA